MKNFRIINLTACTKILKKHAKKCGWQALPVLYEGFDTGHMLRDDNGIVDLLKRTEDLAVEFEKDDRHVVMQRLRVVEHKPKAVRLISSPPGRYTHE